MSLNETGCTLLVGDGVSARLDGRHDERHLQVEEHARGRT
jgi:hypothetical protein